VQSFTGGDVDAVVDHLAAYAFGLTYESLGTEAVHETKRRIIDSLGIAMAGYLEEPCKIARAIATESVGRPGSTVLGTQHRAPPELAAFANGTMVHSQDYMDTYLSKEACHPSDNISAMLAIAEHEGASGKQVILGTVLAYEVMCRLCDAAGIRERGWDHVSYGVVSGALGVARILGLQRDEIKEAIALAVAPNAALRQTRVGEISMWKACAPANAARNGLFAARLAEMGLTGPRDPMTGAKAFQKQVSGAFELAPFSPPGGPFMINRTYIKRWPVQYNVQAGIEAAFALRAEVPDPENIDSMTIDIAAVGRDLSADTEAKWDPQTRETADHSLPYIVVSALVDGEVDRSTFDRTRFRDPARLALVRRVEVRADPEFSRQYPGTLSVKVSVRTRDGKLHVRQVDHPKGHPANPMTDREVEGKFRRLTRGVLRQRQIDRALDQLWRLDELREVGPILRTFIV
jgi:2-methylcitrate dehydratase